MSTLFAVARAIEGVIGIVTATGRLLRAEKALPRSVPPAPMPIGDDGALQYLRGANDEAWKLEQREHLRRQAVELARKAAAQDEEQQPERPSGGLR